MTTKLNEIRARLEAATPGPWYVSQGNHNLIMAKVPNYYAYEVIADAAQRGDFYSKADVNAALIAHAPTDIAKLLAVVEVLSAGLQDLRASLNCPYCITNHNIANKALTKADEILGEK